MQVEQGEPYSVPLPNLIGFLEPQTSLLCLSQGGKLPSNHTGL